MHDSNLHDPTQDGYPRAQSEYSGFVFWMSAVFVVICLCMVGLVFQIKWMLLLFGGLVGLIVLGAIILFIWMYCKSSTYIDTHDSK